jgi:glycine/D-amino acid oxidase-like deaminating enzyme
MRTTAKDGGFTSSVWSSTSTPRFNSTPEHETDVAIVGAGIAGLTIAFELVRRGTRVTILDDGPIGGGETGRTSAHLTSAIDNGYVAIERRFDEEGLG